MWEQDQKQYKDGNQRNQTDTIKDFKEQDFEADSIKKATWIWPDLSIYYSFWICPPIHSITLQWWTVIPQRFNSSEMYNSKLIF